MMHSSDHQDLLKELREIRELVSSLDTKILESRTQLQDEIHSIRTEVVAFQLRAIQLDDLTAWSARFRETITLQDLERLREEVQSLKEFKTKGTMFFASVQFLMAGVVAWITKG
jgi:hypothetical protein